MERTITQNGALYAIQHNGSSKFQDAWNARAIACKKIQADPAKPVNSAAQKIKTEEQCFISSGT